jgi:hypothetical protein
MAGVIAASGQLFGGTRRARACAAVLASAAAAALVPWAATPADAAPRAPRLVADAAASPVHPVSRYGRRAWLRVGGPGRWRSYLWFDLRGVRRPVRRATLELTVLGRTRAPVQVRATKGRRPWGELRVRGAHPPQAGAYLAAHRPRRRAFRRIAIDVTRAVRRGRVAGFVLMGSGRRTLVLHSGEARRGRPLLVVRSRRARLNLIRQQAPSLAGDAIAVGPATGAPAAAGAASPPAPAAGRLPARRTGSVLVTPAEIAARPTAGPAWKALKAVADAALGRADLADEVSDHDVRTLAAALVAARTGSATHRTKATSGIEAAIGTERGGRVLGLARNLVSYVVAADVLDLRRYDPALDERFRTWLGGVRTKTLSDWSLVSRHETQANNWGTMSGASRVAADAYLGDTADLARAADVFRGWLGDRRAHSSFEFDSDVSWQADPARPVGVNAPGAALGGFSVDGALPDDMRRGCSFRLPPCPTEYGWEAMQGAVVQAHVLHNQGYDAWGWSDLALLRAARFLQRLDALYGGWWATGDDEWQPWLLNHVYGTSFEADAPAHPGKNLGWTDWLYLG